MSVTITSYSGFDACWPMLTLRFADGRHVARSRKAPRPPPAPAPRAPTPTGKMVKRVRRNG